MTVPSGHPGVRADADAVGAGSPDAPQGPATAHGRSRLLVPLAVTAITLVGLLLRLATLDESYFGDELFTYQIATQPGLADVLAGVRSDLEISPPLYFVLGWMAQQLGDPFLWLRMVSLIAGTATIPLTYLLGARTVGRPAGLVGAGLFALSPMGIFYGGEARAYSLMTFLVVLSTLALLRALETRAFRWWMAVTLLYASAMYSHYTCIFVLGAQALWALWTHRDQWRALTVSLAAAVLLFLPWVPGFLADSRAPNQKIIGILEPFGWETFTDHVARLLMGSSFARLSTLPGVAAYALLGVALVIGLVGWLVRCRRIRRVEMAERTVLIVVLAAAAPVGAALYSLAGDDMFVARNLISSLPAIYLVIGALLTALARPAAVAALVLAFAGMGLAAARTFDVDNQRPQNAAVAQYIADRAAPGDVVLEFNMFSGPPATALEVHLGDDVRLVRVPPQPARPDQVLPKSGGRVFVVGTGAGVDQAPSFLPPGYRDVETRTWPGGLYTWPADASRLTVVTYEPAGS